MNQIYVSNLNFPSYRRILPQSFFFDWQKTVFLKHNKTNSQIKSIFAFKRSKIYSPVNKNRFPEIYTCLFFTSKIFLCMQIKFCHTVLWHKKWRMLQKIKTTILIDQQNTSSIIHSLLRRESINLKYVMINLFRKKSTNLYFNSRNV